MNKKRAVQIVLDRAEGPADLCGKKEFRIDDMIGDQGSVWEQADKQLLDWSHTAPERGGYDKTDFTITFEDGNTYSGRFDNQHPNVKGGRESSLADHIAKEVLFYAGEWKPDHMTELQYRGFLASERGSGAGETCRSFWREYGVPSPWAAEHGL